MAQMEHPTIKKSSSPASTSARRAARDRARNATRATQQAVRRLAHDWFDVALKASDIRVGLGHGNVPTFDIANFGSEVLEKLNRCSVSMAQAGRVGVCGVTALGAIGVAVEPINDRLPKLAAEFLNPREKLWRFRLPKKLPELDAESVWAEENLWLYDQNPEPWLAGDEVNSATWAAANRRYSALWALKHAASRSLMLDRRLQPAWIYVKNGNPNDLRLGLDSEVRRHFSTVPKGVKLTGRIWQYHSWVIALVRSSERVERSSEETDSSVLLEMAETDFMM